MKITIKTYLPKTVDLPYLNYNSLLIAFASSHVIDSAGNEVPNLDLLDIIRRADPGDTLFPNWAYGHSVLEYLFEPDAFYKAPDTTRIAAFELIMHTRPDEADYTLEPVISLGSPLMDHIIQNYRNDYMTEDKSMFLPGLLTIKSQDSLAVIAEDIHNSIPKHKAALNALDTQVLCQFVDSVYPENNVAAFDILVEAVTMPCGKLVCECVLSHISEYIRTPMLRMTATDYINASQATL